MKPFRAVLIGVLGVLCAFSQATITGIKLHADPGVRVRPLESVALQVRIYGRAGSQEGRLRRDGARVELSDPNGGWLSKPYRFQGKDEEGFIDEYQSTAGKIFGQMTGRYVLQDGVLYTAPERPGRYTVKAVMGSQAATLTMVVDAAAPSNRKPEQHDFGAEPFSLDPYRDLAEHWAPLIAQEIWWQPKSDYLARFDYDGDWKGGNNWSNLEIGSSQAYVYYAVMETETHYFLIYNAFHPRDYSDKCVAGSCHENDNEGLILTVLKDGTAYGRVQTMETLAHNNVYSFTADRQIRKGVHDIDGPIEFHGHRPIVFVESGGHGIYGTASSHSRYNVSDDKFTPGPGVTYVYKGKAERPKNVNDRFVGYDLLPIYYYWWLRTDGNSGRTNYTFDDFQTYSPRGNRPRAAFDSIGTAFFGREQASNKAKPFWGWHDNRTKKKGVLAVGQWGLDPAYAVSQNLRFPGRFSTDYLFNPYLRLASNYPASQSAGRLEPRTAPSSGGGGSRTVAGRTTPASGPPPASPAPAAETPAPSTGGQSGSGTAGAASGTFEMFLWVDGSVEATIRGSQLHYRTLSGAPYRAFEGIPNRALPAAELSALKIHLKQGRGKVSIVERPSERNGYTTRLRIDDKARGGETYHILLEWRR